MTLASNNDFKSYIRLLHLMEFFIKRNSSHILFILLHQNIVIYQQVKRYGIAKDKQAESFKRHRRPRPYVIDNDYYSSMVAEP